MGQDVAARHFEHRDFVRFGHHLRDETRLLHDWIEGDLLSRREPMLGLELEACLLDADMQPAPRNDELLQALGRPEVVTELGRFNIELNVPPRPARGNGLERLSADLTALWQRCREVAALLGLQVVAIGILPTLQPGHLTLAGMSDRGRYRALNEQVQRQRHGRPHQLDIEAADGARLHVEQHDVMLEAAATSFQVHLQTPAALSLRAYNASIIASACTVAVSANSPVLFGRRLWQETRIPLFEQALDIGTRDGLPAMPLSRVSFGDGYAGWSLAECFRDNLERYEPLLPILSDEPPSRLPHLRLHNGTIWRWNRPLLGFDDDGTPHLRVEHRPMAAGPTVADMMANLAFSVGLITALAHEATPPEAALPFDVAQANFRAAARDGLDATLQRADGGAVTAARELLDRALPLAREGLSRLGVDAPAADAAIGVLQARVASGQTGAVWQCRHLDRNGHDMARMLRDYTARQAEGAPVHCWN